jgi:hypothetical protein
MRSRILKACPVLVLSATAGLAHEPVSPEDFSGLVPVFRDEGGARWHEALTRSGPAPRMLYYGALPWEPIDPPHRHMLEYRFGPMATCFSKENPPPPEVMEEVEAQMRGFQGRYIIGDRWPGNPGTNIALSWSFVPDGLQITRNGSTWLPSNLFATLDSQFGNRSTWVNVFTAAFARWATFGGIAYTRVRFNNNDWDDGAAWGSSGSPGLRGDIRIGMHYIDGSGGILASNFFPSSGGDMVIDSGDFWASGAPNYTFFYNVIMHEHGHGLGFSHVCPANSTKLMEPFATASFRGPQHDDIRAVMRSYNDSYFPNNTIATARPITPAVSVGSTIVIGAQPTGEPPVSPGSIVGLGYPGQQDYFRLDAGSAAKVVTLRLLLIGTTYDSMPQSGSSCPSGGTINSQQMINMGIQAIGNESGNPVYADQSSGGLGVNETITSLLVPPGNFYVRAYGQGGSDLGTQLYRVEVQGISQPTLSASVDTFDDKIRLNWPTFNSPQGHRIFRGTTTNFAQATQIAQVAGASTTFDDTTATPATTYYYWIQTQQFTTTSPWKLWAGPVQGRRAQQNCPGDWNGDGVVDFNDFLSYLNDYNTGNPRADINGDGIVDFNDFLEFLNFYNTPC